VPARLEVFWWRDLSGDPLALDATGAPSRITAKPSAVSAATAAAARAAASGAAATPARLHLPSESAAASPTSDDMPRILQLRERRHLRRWWRGLGVRCLRIRLGLRRLQRTLSPPTTAHANPFATAATSPTTHAAVTAVTISTSITTWDATSVTITNAATNADANVANYG
jgi:hypothetical protein